jgi:hypothetical protein
VRYSFHLGALEEYLGFVSYYADISPGLSESFIKSFESGIEEILSYPEAWQVVEEDVRRYFIKRFPFGIYYCIEADGNDLRGYAHEPRPPILAEPN